MLQLKKIEATIVGPDDRLSNLTATFSGKDGHITASLFAKEDSDGRLINNWRHMEHLFRQWLREAMQPGFHDIEEFYKEEEDDT